MGAYTEGGACGSNDLQLNRLERLIAIINVIVAFKRYSRSCLRPRQSRARRSTRTSGNLRRPSDTYPGYNERILARCLVPRVSRVGRNSPGQYTSDEDEIALEICLHASVAFKLACTAGTSSNDAATNACRVSLDMAKEEAWPGESRRCAYSVLYLSVAQQCNPDLVDSETTPV